MCSAIGTNFGKLVLTPQAYPAVTNQVRDRRQRSQRTGAMSIAISAPVYAARAGSPIPAVPRRGPRIQNKSSTLTGRTVVTHGRSYPGSGEEYWYGTKSVLRNPADYLA